MLAQIFSLGGLIAFLLGVFLSGTVISFWGKARSRVAS